jgi:hypothetical protein
MKLCTQYEHINVCNISFKNVSVYYGELKYAHACFNFSPRCLADQQTFQGIYVSADQARWRKEICYNRVLIMSEIMNLNNCRKYQITTDCNLVSQPMKIALLDEWTCW